MSSLLELPCSIRKTIINLAIFAPFTADLPHLDYALGLPKGLGGRIGLEVAEILQLRSWRFADGVKYLPQQPVISSSSLLLVNHQIRMETLDVLAHSPDFHSYQLDLAFSQDVLLPTWTVIPSLVTQVDTLRVSFRVIGIMKSNDDDEGSSLSFDGNIPYCIWWLYSVLERFLHCGPAGQQYSYKNRRISVKTLDIDIDSLCDLEQEDFETLDHRFFELPYHFKAVRTRYIVEAFVGYFDDLLMMWGLRSIFGALLYERIGFIRLRLKGEIAHEWDLAEYFHDVRPEVAFRDGMLLFARWRPETSRRRQVSGLRVSSAPE